MDIPSRGSKEERIRIPCGYKLIYRVMDIINKTELGKYVSVCKVQSYVACQRGTSGRRVRSDGGSGAVGARGELGAQAEGEREAEAEGEAEGVPLTITPPLDEHRLDAEESEIGRKGLSQRLERGCGVGLPGSWCGTPLPSLGPG